MKSHRRNVSLLWLYPIVIFGFICVIPWWDGSKSGLIQDAWRLPLATAYVNEFPGWRTLLILHVLMTVTLSFVAIGLHLSVRNALKPPTDFVDADRRESL